ncbi:ABC transporter permease [Enterococcus sp. LJL90]
MKFYVNWRTATKAIFKNRKRSILTMFGIIIGIAAVIAILAIGRGFERDTIRSLQGNDSDQVMIQVNFTATDESIYNSNLSFFNDQDLSLIDSVEGVASAKFPEPDYSMMQQNLMIQNESQYKMISLTEDNSRPVEFGRSLTSEDNQIRNKVLVVDSQTAEDLYGSAENAVKGGVTINGQVFTIVGVFQAAETESMFSMMETNLEIPQSSYLYYFPENTDAYAVNVILEDGATPGTVTTDVIKRLEDSGTMRQYGDYQVFDTALLTDGVGQVLGTITLFISAVAGISLFIAGVGVMNMMYISVSERTKEIGIRRALGATKKSIRMQFLLEGMSLTLVGGIIGYIIGILLAYLIGSLVGVSVSVDLFTVTLAVGVSSAIGLIFSVMPASEAARKDLIDILR